MPNHLSALPFIEFELGASDIRSDPVDVFVLLNGSRYGVLIDVNDLTDNEAVQFAERVADNFSTFATKYAKEIKKRKILDIAPRPPGAKAGIGYQKVILTPDPQSPALEGVSVKSFSGTYYFVSEEGVEFEHFFKQVS